MDNNKELIKQIQYYLSDQNLQNDQFFYDQVAADKDHFVDIKCFLNCNKVKKLGITQPNQIVEALKNAQNLELNKDQSMLRRKNINQLPEFKAKKKSKIVGDEDRVPNPFDNIQTTIFTLSLEKDQTVPFRYIQQALLKGHNLFSPYVRFNKNQGNFAIQKKLCKPQIIQKLQKEGLKVGQTTLTVKKAEGKQLDFFWQKHGHHYNGIIDKLRVQHNKKQKAQKKGSATVHKSKKIQQFEFGGQKYNDINQIKSLFKNILCRNPNNKPLPAKQADLVKQLLSYHDKSADKLKDFKHFVVDVNPSFIDTRCLFVVRNDGSREDFSIVKCINNLEHKLLQ